MVQCVKSQLGLGTGADTVNLNQMASPGTCPAARDCLVNAGLPSYGVPPPPYPSAQGGYCPECPQSYALADPATIQALAQNIAVSIASLNATQGPASRALNPRPSFRTPCAVAEATLSTRFRSREARSMLSSSRMDPKVFSHKTHQ